MTTQRTILGHPFTEDDIITTTSVKSFDKDGNPIIISSVQLNGEFIGNKIITARTPDEVKATEHITGMIVGPDKPTQ